MNPTLFGRGVLIGLAIAAPIGAIGLLCIRRTLAHGRLIGFVTGLGAATADACYGALAAAGLTSISALLVAHQDWIRFIGGIGLCLLGGQTMRARPESSPATQSPRGLAAAYGSTLALTLTNPSTILSFAAVFAGLGLATDPASGSWPAIWLVAGVFFGSASWWLFLSGMVGLVRHHLTPGRLRWVNLIAGAAIIAFGVAAIGSAWR